MMNKLFILFLSIFTVSAASVKISDYPRASSLGANDLFIISYYSGGIYTTNKSVTYGTLLTQLATSGVGAVYVNGSLIASPNLANSANVIVNNSSTNITFGVSALTDANISASAAIARSKTAVGTANHIVINDGTGAMSSEATLATSRMANSGVTAGTYGNGSYIPQITVDAKGRVTVVTTNAVSGSAPTGTMVSNGSTFVAGTVPIAVDTTGTNFTGTSTVTITTTNASFKGTVFVDNLVATNGITLGTGGTNLSVTGNVLANGLLVTNTFTDNGAFITPTVTISASDLNLAAGSLFTKNLVGNTTFTFSNPIEGQQFSVVITNGSTFTVTWPATIEWKGGATPVQSVNQTDVYSFIYANGKYLGVQSPGSAPGVEQEAYSAGTVYSLTASAALLDFGTTDPTVTVTDAGTYLIYWGGNYKYNAATFVANQTANMKVRRTNNTAADISNATLTATTRVITTITDDLAVMAGKPVKYVAASGDILQVWGSLSATPSAGSVDCTDAWIVLLRIQ